MTDLISFLRARLDEDRQTIEASRMDDDPTWWMPDWLTRERLLGEVEAKRRLIDEILSYEAKIDNEELGCCHDAEEIGAGGCRSRPVNEIGALRLLALSYVDHPDYDETWRPA